MMVMMMMTMTMMMMMVMMMMMINITIIIIIIVITIHLFISSEQQVQDISQETASRRWPTPSKVLQWFHIHRAPRQGDMLAELSSTAADCRHT